MKPAAPAAELRYFDGSLFVLGELAGTIAEAIVETVFRQDGASRQSSALRQFIRKYRSILSSNRFLSLVLA